MRKRYCRTMEMMNYKCLICFCLMPQKPRTRLLTKFTDPWIFMLKSSSWLWLDKFEVMMKCSCSRNASFMWVWFDGVFKNCRSYVRCPVSSPEMFIHFTGSEQRIDFTFPTSLMQDRFVCSGVISILFCNFKNAYCYTIKKLGSQHLHLLWLYHISFVLIWTGRSLFDTMIYKATVSFCIFHFAREKIFR